MTPPTARHLAAPLIALLLVPASARAEDRDDLQVWTSLTASVDGNIRYYDSAAHLGQVQVRGLLGWDVAKDVNIGAGYSYVRATPRTGKDVHENRIFQQLSFPIGKIGDAKFTARTRLEERFFSNIDGMRLRLRQQVKMSVPLTGPEGLKAIVHTEAMFLLNKQGSTAAGFNQLRTFAGLSIPLKGKTAVEAGYLNQAIFPGDNRYNHVLSLGLTTTF